METYRWLNSVKTFQIVKFLSGGTNGLAKRSFQSVPETLRARSH